MKTVYIIILFFLIFALKGDDLVLRDIYKEWKDFDKTSKIKDFGLVESSQSLNLIFGENYNKGDHIRKVKILSAKLESDKLNVTIEFPEIVLDISEITVNENISYDVISRSIKLPVEKDKTYEVEFYGIRSVQTSNGENVKKNKPVKFASLKLLSSKEWLAHLKNKLEVEDAASGEFKKFLSKEIPSFKLESANYEKVGASLKKICKDSGYDLIFMPGNEDPENIKTFNLSYENVSVLELVKRISSLKNLKYRLGTKEVIIATEEAFKKSKSIRSKDGLDLPGLKVDVKNKRMVLDAKVCMSSGILEYLMCLPNSFEHESVFMTKVKPELIHMGLLLVQADQMPYTGRAEIMKKLKANKSRLKIEVEWNAEGKVNRVDLNKLLIDRSQNDKKTLAEDLWFFAGSYFTESNVYAANLHQSVISLQQHPASVIHYGKLTEDPYRSTRGGFEINEKLCPKTNTEVKIVFTVHPQH